MHYFLTPRNEQTLSLLDRYSFLTAAHVEELMLGDTEIESGSKSVAIRRVLRSLREKGLVDSFARRIGGDARGSSPGVWYLTTKGVKAVLEPVRSRRRATEASVHRVRHALAVADVAVAFSLSAREREGHGILLMETEYEAAQRFGQQLVVPDLYVIYDTPKVELSLFVEVELQSKTSSFKAKVRKYLSWYQSKQWKSPLGVFPLVLVVTNSQRKAENLKVATEAQRPPKGTEFVFATLESVHRDPLQHLLTEAL